MQESLSLSGHPFPFHSQSKDGNIAANAELSTAAVPNSIDLRCTAAALITATNEQSENQLHKLPKTIIPTSENSFIFNRLRVILLKEQFYYNNENTWLLSTPEHR